LSLSRQTHSLGFHFVNEDLKAARFAGFVFPAANVALEEKWLPCVHPRVTVVVVGFEVVDVVVVVGVFAVAVVVVVVRVRVRVSECGYLTFSIAPVMLRRPCAGNVPLRSAARSVGLR
jgi:hypothetical protein